MGDDWVTVLRAGELTAFGGLGIATAAILLIALRILLPRSERRRIRLPLYLLLLNLGLVALRLLPLSAGLEKAVTVASVFVILTCIARAGFLLVVDWLLGKRLARPLPKIFRDIIQAVVYFGVAFVTLPLIGLEPGQLLTTSALLTAVIGLSMQETLGNLFAGLAIQAQRPFEIGDWIQFDFDEQLVGRVTEINWRATKIMTNDQVEVIVPNGTLAKAPIRNYTQPTRLSRRTVLVQGPYEAAPHRVVAAAQEAMRGCPGVLRVPEPEVLLKSYADSGIEYAVRYFVDDYARRYQIDAGVRTRIWYAFQRAGISIPFPIRDVRARDMTKEAEQAKGASVAERRSALSAIDFLADLPDEVVQRLAEGTRRVVYSDGEAIIRQGEEGAELFIVVRGEVVVLIGPDSVHASEVARLGPGKFFGEMSLMTGERRTATVRADGACELFVLGHDEVRAILEMEPHLAEHISEVLAHRQAQLEERTSNAAEAKKHEQARSRILLSRIKDFFSL